MRKVLVLALAFGTIAALNAACTGDDDDDDDHNPPDSITMSGGNAVTVGSTLQLTATAVGGDHDGEDISAESTWVSSSASKATVSSTGLVTGVAAGTTTITATHDEVVGSVVVTVSTGAAATFNFSIRFTGWPHGDADSGTGVRVMRGPTRVYCQSLVNQGADWTYTAPAGLLEAGEDYTVEVYGDAGGGDNNNVYNTAGDHTWLFTLNDVAANYAGVHPHSTTQAAITWPNGTACP